MIVKRPYLRGPDSAAEVFFRGFLATGMVSALAEAKALQGSKQDKKAAQKKIVRQSIQGGAALASGTMAARAVANRDFGKALTATALGIAAVVTAENMIPSEKADAETSETALEAQK